MYIRKDKLEAAFNELEENLNKYSLPLWEELPDLELYMDQVISLLNRYLAIYYETLGTEKFITPSMINNYVKLGTVPSPVKKKYSKLHLAYLFVVCTLKRTLDMATIQRIMPVDMDEETAKNTYNSFVKNQHKAVLYVAENVRKVANPILELEGNNQERMNDLLMQLASAANLCKILTEKVTKIHDEESDTDGV